MVPRYEPGDIVGQQVVDSVRKKRSIIGIYARICTFRAGASAVPATRGFMWAAVAVDIAVNAFTGLGHYPLPIALFNGVLSTLVLALAVALVLWRHCAPQRIPQILAALLGCDVFTTIIALPIWAWLTLASHPVPYADLASLVLIAILAWTILVFANIWRLALHLWWLWGILWSVALFMLVLELSALLTNFLAPWFEIQSML